jgi:hypothetical protein
MEEEKKEQADRSAHDNLVQMFTAFGQAFGEIFNDPELKAKAKELGDAAGVSMETLGRRFKDEEVREKFRQAGDAAEDFGRSVSDYFKSKPEE